MTMLPLPWRLESRLKSSSQPAFEQWENLFKDPVLTGAIIDRLAHKAHVLDISREQGGRFEETIAWMTNKQPAKIDDAD